MANQTKIYEVENIQATLKGAKSAALIDYQGLSAEQIREMRDAIREAGGSMMVAKNTLISIALANMGIKLDEFLTGPTALVLGDEDEIAPLKAVEGTRKKYERPEFKLGVYQGAILSLQQLTKFISLPSKDILLGKIVGGLANPLQRLVYSMKFNQTKLLLTLKAYKEGKESTN
jgi:large subunit ribosomal protein L10